MVKGKDKAIKPVEVKKPQAKPTGNADMSNIRAAMMGNKRGKR